MNVENADEYMQPDSANSDKTEKIQTSIQSKSKTSVSQECSLQAEARRAKMKTGPNLQMSEIGEKELEDLKEKFMQKLNKTADEIMSISQLTLQQNNSAVWFEERRKRITAFSFGKVCKMKRTTNPKIP
ncbi:hypothetical protein ILUMI_04990 [Ignelater luminosus]|uniref:Uncharacterized protein n=1 Tax=Ignelater luminosus TaxID=2038154 RepID=A0A8K0DBU1_IGNLU|nr:hypothetical protein ILUMI_04990 [Ignelater luminosus]